MVHAEEEAAREMTEDVGTTLRKPLTPTQRLKLFEAFKGVCALCQRKINEGERWRDEHLRALALGGTNEWDNRAPVHEACARAKDADDLPRIAKAKRQKRAALGIKAATSRKLQSRGFPAPEKSKRGVDKSCLPPLGPSNIARRFEGC